MFFNRPAINFAMNIKKIMELSNQTIFITGGSSGIGLELGKRFIEKNNKVIICGRSAEKLEAVKKQYPQLETVQCDLSDEKQCLDLAHWIRENHPDLNVLINNAALVHNTPFLETDTILEKLKLEVNTNLLAPIRLIKLLHPVLEKNDNPTIINITTGLVYVPRADYPFYNATKAGLHSFTQVLRMQLKSTNFRIIEVLFPAVKTPWHKGKPPKIAITVEKAVDDMIKGMKKGKLEIKVSKVKILYNLFRIAPGFALKKINSLQK